MLKSDCCTASVIHYGSPDFIGEKTVSTCWYVCSECGQDCNILSNNKIKEAWYIKESK